MRIANRQKGLKTPAQVCFRLAVVVLMVAGIMYYLSFIEWPWLTRFLGDLPEPSWGPIPVVFALIGTGLGAIGATGPPKTDRGERWRDRSSLVGWAVLFVGTLVAVVLL